MKKNMIFQKAGLFVFILTLIFGLIACGQVSNKELTATNVETTVAIEENSKLGENEKTSDAQIAQTEKQSQNTKIVYGEPYTSRDEVSLYLYEFQELPINYITKDEAYDLGWNPQKGNLNEVAPGMSIGGDKFGNREGQLPKETGRQYYECDIDYFSGTRNAKRLVYSNDGLIFYTDDHYASFEQIY